MTNSAISLIVIIVYLAGSTAASEIALDRQFRIQRIDQMPSSAEVNGLHVMPQNYDDFDAIHWLTRLQADGATTQPLIENFHSADFVVHFPAATDAAIHWSSGSHAAPTDFQPHLSPLGDREQSFESYGGRSSDGIMPFFNIATSPLPTQPGGGLIFAIGWSGDWQASFQKIDASRVRIRAGLKKSRFRLAPSEAVQLPSILVMSYAGRPIEGQNKFRRLLSAHFTPDNHPAMKLMPVAASVHGMLAFNDTTEQNLIGLSRDIAETNLPLDTFWLDAGWNQNGFPGGQGNHLPDSKRFPNGLAPVGSAVQQTHKRFLMWFEPERAMSGTWLDQHHPEWLLKPNGTPPELRYMEKDGFRLLDLANALARQWAVEAISNEITNSKVAIYRQDFNEYPAYFWNTVEPETSIGLREIRYINGLYEFLDQLRQRHPALIIDSCASGGRRLDLMMMSRTVCLWRSDSCWDAPSYPRNVQAMTHGLSHWLPLHGLGSVATDPVALRSGMGACASFAINYRDPTAIKQLERHLQQYLPIRHLFGADYYPLTAWSVDPSQWLAIQFHDPQTGEGVVQAFHGVDAVPAKIQLKLEGLEAQANYMLTDWDAVGNPVKVTGHELATQGITVDSTLHKNDARVWQYAKQ